MAAKMVVLTAYVRHNGTRYGPGDRIELSAADAERLARLGVAVINETVAEEQGVETVPKSGNKRRR